MTETQAANAIRDEWGSLASDFVEKVRRDLADPDPRAIRACVEDLHAADLADLIEALDQTERVRLIAMLGRSFDVEALAELDEAVRDELIEALPPEVVASAIDKLDTDDALYLIEDLDKAEQDEILAKVSQEDRVALNRALDYPENTAGRLMQTEFVAVPSFWTAGRAIEHFRAEAELPEDFVEVYVVDPTYHLVGTVPVSRILRSQPGKKISELMEEEQTVFNVTDPQEDVAYKFEQYNLVSAAVVDADNRLVGMLTVDDVVDVIQDEAEEDILHLGGVGGEETISDTVWQTTRSRFLWLLFNLATAVLASWVISWFDATIEQMVALAVLMPIVASMGGNAGTQTMTVAVRALATRHLGPLNAMKVTLRESAVGLINGLFFALIIGLFAWWWFGSNGLGLVIGAAMIINLLAAALAGILVPLALDSFDVDPAIASGVFVTTVTDVVGFFAFLGARGGMVGVVTIARATAADRADWERLWQAWQDHMEGAVPAAITATTWDMMMRNEGGLTALIARTEDGTAVGFANASATPFAWTGGLILFLQDLFIVEEVRGAGAGEALLKGVYSLADELGATQVFWMVDEDDSRLQGFYARHGIRTPYLRYMRRPWPW